MKVKKRKITNITPLNIIEARKMARKMPKKHRKKTMTRILIDGQ